MKSIGLILAVLILIASWVNTKVTTLTGSVHHQRAGNVRFYAEIISKEDDSLVVRNTSTGEIIALSSMIATPGQYGLLTATIGSGNVHAIKWSSLSSVPIALGEILERSESQVRIGSTWYTLTDLTVFSRGDDVVGKQAYGVGGNVVRVDID